MQPEKEKKNLPFVTLISHSLSILGGIRGFNVEVSHEVMEMTIKL